MLMPAEKTTVAPIMADQPAFASVCKADCDLVLVSNKAGNGSFPGAPKTRERGPSCTSMVTVPPSNGHLSLPRNLSCPQAYILPKSAFESHHQSADDPGLDIGLSGRTRKMTLAYWIVTESRNQLFSADGLLPRSNCRSFAYHPQTEKRLGPLALWMTSDQRRSRTRGSWFYPRCPRAEAPGAPEALLIDCCRKATADPSLTTRKLKNVWGPLRSG